MKFVKGNILDADHGIIGHQVNCQLVMGAGLAKQVREKYPHVYNEYKLVMAFQTPEQRFGRCQMVVATPPNTLFIANLFGQMHFRPRGIVHTDYGALASALRNLQRWRETFFPKYSVYLPHGLGSGLAGGEWNVVEGIIRDAVPDAIIVRYVQ